MELKQLYYFVTVADEGGISSAARRLYMTQPPLSAQIKSLEEELGCTLFTRTKKGTELTEAGKLLYQRAVGVLEMADAVQREVSALGHANKTIFRLGVVSSVSVAYAVNWIAKFCEMYPNVVIEMTEANTYDLAEKVRANQIDLAIVRTPLRLGGLDAGHLLHEDLVAYGIPSHLAKDTTISIQSLSNLPLVLYRRWEGIIRQQFEAQNIHPNIKCLCDDAHTAIALVEEKMGIGIVPISALKLRKNEALSYAYLTQPSISSDIIYITKEDANHSPIASLFIEYLKNQTAT